MTQAKVVLSADSSGLERGMRRAEGAISGVESRLGAFQKIATAAAAGLGAFGGSIGVAFLVQLTRAAVDGMDALNDFADATGATVESASALEDVALRTGTTLENVEGILVKFNATLKETGKDDKAAQIFKQLGLNVEELKRIDPAEALRRTAVELARFADNGDKARIIQELFGKSVREAAPFLKDLAEQGKLNATVTKEQAEQAETFNKQIFALQTSLQTAGRELVSAFLPSLVDVGKEIEKSAKRGSLFVDVLYEIATFSPVGALSDALSSRAARTEGEAERYRNLIVSSEIALNAARERNDEKAEAMQERRLATLRAKLKAIEEQALRTAKVLPLEDLRRGEFDRSEAGRPSLTAPKGKKDDDEKKEPSVADILRNEGVNFRRIEISGTEETNAAIAARNLKEYTDQRERLNAVVANTPTAKKRELVTQVELLNKAFDEGQITLGDWVTESERLSKAIEDLEPQVEKASKELSDFAQEARRNIQDALGDTLLRTFKGDTDDIVKLWGDMLLRLAAQAAAAELGKKLLGSGKDGDNGWLGTLFSAVAAAFGGGGGASGRANGGPVAAGSLYEVNERGAPELLNIGSRQFLMMGRQSGSVTPMQQGGGQKQGVLYQDNRQITVQSGVTRDELMRVMQLQRDTLRAEFRVHLQRVGVA